MRCNVREYASTTMLPRLRDCSSGATNNTMLERYEAAVLGPIT